MSKVKKWAAIFMVGMLGAGAGLGVWRAVTDYMDFLKMRAWVAQMQQLQADAAKQQAPARAVQAPAPEAPK